MSLPFICDTRRLLVCLRQTPSNRAHVTGLKHATNAHYSALTTVGRSQYKPTDVHTKQIFVRKQT